MSSAVNEIQVQNIDHLGIVAGIVDEIGWEHVTFSTSNYTQGDVTVGSQSSH